MASTFQVAVAQALVEQPWYVRRKDTITAVAGMVLQASNVVLAYASSWPEWVNVVIAFVIGVCQIVVHAGTPGAITPSQARRLESAGQRAYLDMESESGVYAPGGHVEDPVTDQPEPGASTRVEVPVSGAVADYAGRHRASEVPYAD